MAANRFLKLDAGYASSVASFYLEFQPDFDESAQLTVSTGSLSFVIYDFTKADLMELADIIIHFVHDNPRLPESQEALKTQQEEEEQC